MEVEWVYRLVVGLRHSIAYDMNGFPFGVGLLSMGTGNGTGTF